MFAAEECKNNSLVEDYFNCDDIDGPDGKSTSLYLEKSAYDKLHKKIVSCGGIIYTWNPTKVFGLILGFEADEWYPFTGSKKSHESYVRAAIREVYEESCKTAQVIESQMILKYIFKKSRRYAIGICYAQYSIMEEFEKNHYPGYEQHLHDEKGIFEKSKLAFIPFGEIDTFKISGLARCVIEAYYDDLLKICGDSPIQGAVVQTKQYITSHPRPLKLNTVNLIYQVKNIRKKKPKVTGTIEAPVLKRQRSMSHNDIDLLKLKALSKLNTGTSNDAWD